MRRPKVSIDNADALFRYYTEYQPNVARARRAHRAISAVYTPRIEFADGAEERIARRLDQRAGLILSPYHQSNHDAMVVASLPIYAEVIESLIGHTRILAKAGLYRYPLVRPFIEMMGAVPVFRSKDVPGENEEQRAHRHRANRLAVDLCVRQLVNRDHAAIFPGGGRDKEGTGIIQALRPGIAEMATIAVDQSAEVSIVPIGMKYGHEHASPYVHIGMPYDVAPDDTPEFVLRRTRTDMQAAQDAANEQYWEAWGQAA